MKQLKTAWDIVDGRQTHFKKGTSLTLLLKKGLPIWCNKIIGNGTLNLNVVKKRGEIFPAIAHFEQNMDSSAPLNRDVY